MSLRLGLLSFAILLTTSASYAIGSADIAGAIGAHGACQELHSNWTPQYASIIYYYKFNGALGSIANAANIPFTVGSTGTAGNANGTGLSYVNGLLDQAVSFDGVDDRIKLAAGPTSVQTSYTVALWLKPSGTATTGIPFIRGASVGCFYNPSMALNNSTGALTVNESGCGGTGAIVTTTISTTNWTHIAVTRNGATATVYVNGVSVGSTSSQPSPGSTSVSGIVVGSVYTNTNAYANYWAGTIDDLAIWSVDLTAPQVLALYNGQVCP